MSSRIFTSACVLVFILTNAANADQQFSKASNSFAAELYQKTIEGQNGNVIISPISIQSALTLLMLGTDGDTKAEMMSGLKYPSGFADDEIAKNFESLTASVRKTNGLKTANKIYLTKNYSVKNSFNDVAKKCFATEAENLDFTQQSQSAATINGWVEENTNKKIKDLVKPDMLDSSTRLVLVNAIYFKGNWTYQFDPKMTSKAPFYLNNDDSVEADFMRMITHLKFGSLEDLDSTAVELPYKDSNMSMLIILPNSRTGLSALERKLNTVDLEEVTKKLKSKEVNVEIPKFKIEFEVDLNESLKKLGIKKVFEDGADLSNLLNKSEPLRISKIAHKAIIEVSEEGAEAAAATKVSVNTKSAFKRHNVFICNQPFIFVLRDTDSTLFMGRVQRF